MANMASVAYAIEGSVESLNEIHGAICLAIASKETFYEEYLACKNLGYTEGELKGKRLGGEISEEPEIVNEALKFWAEERWGLQDFEELLRRKFPDIKVYWTVEEPGCEVFCTNDKEGKYFPDRYWVDTAQDDIYNSDYFITEKSMYEWLSKITNGKVKSKEDVEAFNREHEEAGDDCENFIYIHEFEVID